MALSENGNGVPQHIAIIMDGNGRWAKIGDCPVQPAMQPVRKHSAILQIIAVPLVCGI